MKQVVKAYLTIFSHNYDTPLNLSSKIRSVEIVKDINVPNADIKIKLKLNKGDLNLLQIIRDDDWLHIEIIKQNGNGYKIIGLVNGIRESLLTDTNGAIKQDIIISATDFSKIFTNCEILFNPLIPTIPGLFSSDLWNILDAMSDKATPGELIKKYLSFFLNYANSGNNSNLKYFKMPKSYPTIEQGETVGDWVNLQDYIDTTNIKGIVKQLFSLIAPPRKASIDQFLRPYTNEAWNEFFYDTRRIAVNQNAWTSAVIFRPKPYLDKEIWNGLTRHEITDKEITGYDLGISGNERVNYFMATPYIPQSSNLDVAQAFWTNGGAQYPILIKDSIEKHGLKMLDIETQYVDALGNNPVDMVATLTNKLYQGYHNLPDMLNGTINLKNYRPEIQIGERLLYSNIEFYIEAYHVAVQVNEQLGFTSITQEIQVTRGMSVKDKQKELEKAVMLTVSKKAITGALDVITPKHRFLDNEITWTRELENAVDVSETDRMIAFKFINLSQPWKTHGTVKNDVLPQSLYNNAKQLAKNVVIIQTVFGSNVIVVSGYRSDAYNTAVGGAPNSQHKQAKAIDIYIPGYNTNDMINNLYKTVELLIDNGKIEQGGLGIYYKGANSFIHYDNRGVKVRWKVDTGFDDADEYANDYVPSEGYGVVSPEDAPTWKQVTDEYIL